MRFIPVQDAMVRLKDRQSKVDGLHIDVEGRCAHYGKLSPGCLPCFCGRPTGWSVYVGETEGLPNICNSRCAYCFGYGSQASGTTASHHRQITDWILTSEKKGDILTHLAGTAGTAEALTYVFSGDSSEVLLYLPVVRQYLRFFRKEADKTAGKHGWAKLYTNGLLLDEPIVRELADLGLDEIRVHVGASSFADSVYCKLDMAVRRIPVVTVETPSWPPHRRQLFRMLPRLDEIGVAHLNLIQVAVTRRNVEAISLAVPDAACFQLAETQLDDNGLSYELMREAIENRYSFSVLDCNALVRCPACTVDLISEARYAAPLPAHLFSRPQGQTS